MSQLYLVANLGFGFQTVKSDTFGRKVFMVVSVSELLIGGKPGYHKRAEWKMSEKSSDACDVEWKHPGADEERKLMYADDDNVGLVSHLLTRRQPMVAC